MRDRLKKSEFWSAMILLVLHVAVFPIVLSLLSQVKGYSLSAAQTFCQVLDSPEEMQTARIRL